jgi:hypothetical protein
MAKSAFKNGRYKRKLTRKQNKRMKGGMLPWKKDKRAAVPPVTQRALDDLVIKNNRELANEIERQKKFFNDKFKKELPEDERPTDKSIDNMARAVVLGKFDAAERDRRRAAAAAPASTTQALANLALQNAHTPAERRAATASHEAFSRPLPQPSSSSSVSRPPSLVRQSTDEEASALLQEFEEGQRAKDAVDAKNKLNSQERERLQQEIAGHQKALKEWDERITDIVQQPSDYKEIRSLRFSRGDWKLPDNDNWMAPYDHGEALGSQKWHFDEINRLQPQLDALSKGGRQNKKTKKSKRIKKSRKSRKHLKKRTKKSKKHRKHRKTRK